MPPKLVIQVLGDTSNLERSLKRASRSAQGFDRGMRNAGRGALSATASFTGLRRAMLSTSAAFLSGAGLVAAFTSTINKAAGFERSLNVLQAVSSATARQMKAAGAEAKKLGADLTLPATSAADAAVGMTELAKGGLSVADTLAAARGTLQLAAAAHIEVGEAAQIAARQLNAFQLRGGEAGRVADVLANVANSATGDITDFAIAFQQSSAVANQFNLTIEDTAAALAVMANRGVVGSDAGTSLRVMLSRLVPQTAKAREVMGRLGIVIKDAAGNILPFRHQLIQYQRVLARLTPVQRQMAVQTIFGADAQRAANIIFGGGLKVYDKMRAAVSRAGAAAKLAAAQNKGFTGAMDALKSVLETTQITLGTLLLPELTKYARAAAKWLGDTKNQERIQRDFSSALKSLGEILVTVGGVLRTAASVAQKFSDAVGGAKNTVELLGVAVVGLKLRALILGLQGTGVAAAGAATKVGVLNKRLAFLSGMGPIGVAIGLTVLIQNKKEIDDWFKSHGLGVLTKSLLDIHEENDGNPLMKAIGKAKDALFGGSKGTVTAAGPTWGQRAGDEFQRRLFNIPEKLSGTVKTDIDQTGIKLGRQAAAALKAGVGKGAKDEVTKGATKRVGGMFHADTIGALGRGAKTFAGLFDSRDFAAGSQRRQFQALGLTAEGGERAPTIKGLRAMLGNLEGDVKGTPLDTSKLRSRFAVMRKIITGEFGKAREDVRRTMQGMLDDIDAQLGDRRGGGSGFRHVSPNKLARALGLGDDRASIRRSAAVLSQIGAGGMAPGRRTQAFALAGGGGGGTTINIQNFHSSAQNVRQFEAEMVKRARSRPQVRRGSR